MSLESIKQHATMIRDLYLQYQQMAGQTSPDQLTKLRRNIMQLCTNIQKMIDEERQNAN